jgi:hypothetical protein
MHRLVPKKLFTFSLLTALTFSVGCGGGEEYLDSSPVAQLGGETLTGSGLTAFLLRSPEQPDQRIAAGIVSMWIDYAMMVEAINRRIDLTADSILTDISTTTLMGRAIAQYADIMGLSGVEPALAQVDSLIRTDQVRVFRVHRFSLESGQDSLSEQHSGTLFNIYAAVVNGADIATVIDTMDSDVVADLTVELAPASTYEELPPELARVIWRLRDGEVSRPMQGTQGVQLIQRVPASEARESYSAWLKPKLQQQADRRFTDSLAAGFNIELINDGLIRLRSALEEPIEVTGSEPLVSWQGGEVTPNEARDWISGLLPAERAQLSVASETVIEQLGVTMARRKIFFALASSDSRVDTSAIRAAIVEEFRSAIPALWDGISSGTNSDGSQMGMANSWLTEVFDGARPYQRMPGTLAGWLRSKMVLQFDGRAFLAAGREANRLWVDPRIPVNLPQ